MTDAPCLIVGLGNPGPEYELTRHNAGFLVLDHYADTIGCRIERQRFNGYCGQGRDQDRRVILLKPLTYMNRSGLSVAACQRFFKITTDRLLVIHDDLDLPPGRIKIVAGGGAGGHNGIRSLVRELGDRNFARLKIGIGRPVKDEQGRGIPVDRYVLAGFSRDELARLENLLPLTDEAIQVFVDQGVQAAMNRINGVTR